MTNRTDILRDDASDPFAGERLKVSYFHDREKVLNLRDAWSSWNGFKFADYYYDVDYEYFCIRTPAVPMTSVRCRNIWLRVKTPCRCSIVW